MFLSSNLDNPSASTMTSSKDQPSSADVIIQTPSLVTVKYKAPPLPPPQQKKSATQPIEPITNSARIYGHIKRQEKTMIENRKTELNLLEKNIMKDEHSRLAVLSKNNVEKHTQVYTHTYIYICVCVYVTFIFGYIHLISAYVMIIYFDLLNMNM